MKSDILCWEVIPTPRPDRPEFVVSSAVKSFKETQTQESAIKHSDVAADTMKTLTKADLLFIKDLEPAEKSKIAVMIQQIVRLEQTCAEFSKENDDMKLKLEKKSELCDEVQECIERLSSENDQLKKELASKDEIIQQNCIKMDKTNELLKLTSSTNKKLQKKLNTKKRHIEVQTESDFNSCNISLQTSLLDPSVVLKTLQEPLLSNQNTEDNPAEVETQDSMTAFLSKLDTLCDKLSAIDRQPVGKENGSVMVHNHKTEGQLLAANTSLELVYRAPEEVEEREGGVIEPDNIKDSIMMVKQGSKCGTVKLGTPKNKAGYNSRLYSIIDELEGISHEDDEDDEETLLCDLFYKV